MRPDAKAADQPCRVGHQIEVVPVDRRRDRHFEAMLDDPADPGNRLREAPLAAHLVVRLGRRTVEADLQGNPAAPQAFLEPVDHLVAKEHAVGQHHEIVLGGDVADDGKNAAHHERLAAGDQEAAGAEIARLIDQAQDLVGAHLAGRDVIAARYVAVRATKVAVVRDEYVHVGQATEVERAAAAAIFRRQPRRLPDEVDSFQRVQEGDGVGKGDVVGDAISPRQSLGDLPDRIRAGTAAQHCSAGGVGGHPMGPFPIDRQRHPVPDTIGESGRVIDPVACLIVGNRRRTNGRFLRGRLSLRKRFAQIAQQILHLGQDGRDV